MVLPQRFLPSRSVIDTLAYFDRYDYPLTKEETWFWQTGSDFSQSEISASFLKLSSGFSLNRVFLTRQRKNRALYSRNKLEFATPAISLISRLPFIKAVFITGALAMSNSPVDDDIDIMVITKANTLWIIRPLVTLILKLKGLRRNPYLPEHSSVRVSDKICDNLWLDLEHLYLPKQNLYTAHELLQAKCLYDRGDTYYRFISQNSWAKKYLPVAYTETLKHLKNNSYPENSSFYSVITNCTFYILNLLLFIAQYLYMRPRLTAEKVGLGYAYFHPQRPVCYD
jgi:hypothetical protein